MAVKSFHKMRNTHMSDEEQGLKIHIKNCDAQYRWSMWRMYLNEDLSRVISNKRDFSDKANKTSSVTDFYTNHPDGMKYGHQMKQLFRSKNPKSSDFLSVLPDNLYLVYGLPRVSLMKRTPEEIKKLHYSVAEHETQHKYKQNSRSDLGDTDRQISKLFDFVRTDGTEHESTCEQLLRNCSNVSQERLATIVKSNVVEPKQNVSEKIQSTHYYSILNLAKRESVNKGRSLWKNLAQRKKEIIEIGRRKNENSSARNHANITSDLLHKQHQLFTTTISKRTSKDLWKSLANRKREILQLKELNWEENIQKGDIHLKNNEQKSTHLWNIIFSKKNHLLQIQKLHGDGANKTSAHDQRKLDSENFNNLKGKKTPQNIDDNFQKELTEKLRKRRERIDVVKN